MLKKFFTKKIFLNKKIGSGSFGDVYLSRNNKHINKVFKQFKKEEYDHFIKRIAAEFRYVKNIYGDKVTLKHQDGSYILTMPMLGRNLWSYVRKSLSFINKVALVQELVFAFNDLRCRGYIHNDIKEDNIVLKRTRKKNKHAIFNLAIIDFGMIDESSNNHFFKKNIGVELRFI